MYDSDHRCEGYGLPEIEPHTCPYQIDVNDDYEFLCQCCEDCKYECLMDI